MRVCGIIGSRIKPDQHAHAVVFRIHREYFDVDTWRRFRPLRLSRRFQRRYERPHGREQRWGKTILLIAVTGYGQDKDRRRSLEAGFNYHMVKPIDFAELRKVLSDVTNGRFT
jgi:CheY-like chemotaxis protein